MDSFEREGGFPLDGGDRMSLDPAKYDIKIYQGATFTRRFIWWIVVPDLEADPPEAGSPKDLTGWKARMQVRRHASDEDPLLQASTEDLGITALTDDGVIDIVISDEETRASSASEVSVWDLEMEDPAGIVTKLLYGDAPIFAEVTK